MNLSGEGVRERVLAGALISVVVGVPLAIVPGFFLFFDVTPKIIALLAGTALALIARPNFLRGLQSATKSHVNRAFLGLLVAQACSLALSTVLSENPGVSLAGSHWRRFGLVTHGGALVFAAALLGWLVLSRSRLISLLRAIAVAGLVSSLYGLCQYAGFDPLLPSEVYHFGEGSSATVRPPGPLGHAGYFATYLLHVVFLAAALAKIDPSERWRGFGALVSMLGSAAVILSGTRSAVLGLVVGGLFLAAWYRPRASRLARYALVVAAGLALFSFTPTADKLRNRVRFWYEEDRLGQGRIWLWRDSFHLGARNWMVGTGLETFSSAFPRVRSIELASAFPDGSYESPHNVFLDAFTSQGALGALISISLAILAAAATRRAAAKGEKSTGYIAGALVASFCSNQFLAFTVPTALYFYCTVAMLVALASADEESLPAFRRNAWFETASLAAAAVLILFAAQLAVADRRMVLIKRHAEAGHIEEAIRESHRATIKRPAGFNFDLWYSRTMAAAAQRVEEPARINLAWDAAMSAAKRAARLSGDQREAQVNLAACHAAHNDVRGTEDSLRAAIDVAPNWYRPHWMLALLLRETGRTEEALAEAEKALKLNRGNHLVVQTFDQLKADLAQ